jgi:tetratricopeptide (TPR) repeat protein
MIRHFRLPQKRLTSALEDLAEQADRLGLKGLSIECSTYTAEALIQRRDYTHARERLEVDLGKSEKFGLRMETARIHYLLGTVLRLIGDDPDAAPHYTVALRLLSDIQKEPGAEHIFDRPDLHDIYSASVRWTSRKDPR